MEKELNGKIILIDEEDLYLLNENKFYINNYVYTKINSKTIYLHRLIMINDIIKYEYYNNKRAYIDHINRNGLDNRKENLRVVSQNDNIMNRDKQNNNTSGYKGINITINNTYHACIKYKGVRYRKTLPSIEEAVEWRSKKIKELNIYEPELINNINYDKHKIKENYVHREARGLYGKRNKKIK